MQLSLWVIRPAIVWAKAREQTCGTLAVTHVVQRMSDWLGFSIVHYWTTILLFE